MKYNRYSGCKERAVFALTTIQVTRSVVSLEAAITQDTQAPYRLNLFLLNLDPYLLLQQLAQNAHNDGSS
jgi:hypothetical protein